MAPDPFVDQLWQAGIPTRKNAYFSKTNVPLSILYPLAAVIWT